MFLNFFRNILRPQQMFPCLLATETLRATVFPRLRGPLTRSNYKKSNDCGIQKVVVGLNNARNNARNNGVVRLTIKKCLGFRLEDKQVVVYYPAKSRGISSDT